MKRIIFMALACCLMALTSCSSSKSANTAALMLKYQYTQDQADLVNLSKAYGSTISRTMREKAPNPGECADYAVSLAILGHPVEANTWFNLEVHYYPNSAQYVEQLKVQMIPQFAKDTSTSATIADLSAHEQAAAAEGAETVSANDQAAAPVKVKLTKKEKKKLARQKAKAKKKAKRDKEKAKKAKAKAKKNAKKAATKQKEQAKRERELERRSAAQKDNE